jgi:hypothetical protein
MVPGATSVLVLMKVQSTASQSLVKAAVGGVLTGAAGAMVILLVFVWLKP